MHPAFCTSRKRSSCDKNVNVTVRAQIKTAVPETRVLPEAEVVTTASSRCW